MVSFDKNEGIVPESWGKLEKARNWRYGSSPMAGGISPTTSLAMLLASMVTRPCVSHWMPDQLVQQSVLGSQVVKVEALLKWYLISRRDFWSSVLQTAVEEAGFKDRRTSKKVKVKVKEMREHFRVGTCMVTLATYYVWD